MEEEAGWVDYPLQMLFCPLPPVILRTALCSCDCFLFTDVKMRAKGGQRAGVVSAPSVDPGEKPPTGQGKRGVGVEASTCQCFLGYQFVLRSGSMQSPLSFTTQGSKVFHSSVVNYLRPTRECRGPKNGTCGFVPEEPRSSSFPILLLLPPHPFPFVFQLLHIIRGLDLGKGVAK